MHTLHTTTPPLFQQLGPWARRALHVIACWGGCALLASAFAAGHGYRAIAVLAPEQGDQLNGELLQGAAGELYVTAQSGGAHGHGAVIRVGVAGEVTTLHSFKDRRDGGEPDSGLIRGSDGWFYGSTRLGGAMHQGAIFRMSPEGAMTTLHSFERHGDGAFPSRLLQASDGNFYGAAESGGLTERGTVFRLTPAGKFKVIHHFTGLVGEPAQPAAELIQGRDGLLYGTTLDGGSSAGTIFRMRLDGSGLTVLHRFTNGHEGRFPTSALLQASDGNFYGTTKSTSFDIGDTGAAYRLTPAGEYTLLRVFDAEADGAQPDGALIQAANGDFYGTTTTAGPRGGGTVFRLKADGQLTLLHAFSDNHRKGEGPRGALLQGQDGLLYGSTGHFNGPATVFSVAP